MDTSDEAQIFSEALESVEDLPAYQKSEPANSKRQWVENEFERLQILIEKKGYPFRVAAEVLGNSISGPVLSKHYKAVKRDRARALREARLQEEAQLEALPRRRIVDPTTVKIPPPLVHAEVVED